MEPGEGGLYDSVDGKQMTYFRNRGDGSDGVYIVGCDKEQEQQSGGGGAGGGAGGASAAALATGSGGSSASGGGQDRAVYIRYAQKKKQSRKPQKRQQGAQGGQGDGGGGASAAGVSALAASDGGGGSSGGGQQQQRYKHEGDSVLTQVKLDKSLIDFSDKSGSVGHYDSGKKDWLHHDGQGATHSMRADQQHSHIKHEGNHIWVDDGSCWSSKPIQIKADDCS